MSVRNRQARRLALAVAAATPIAVIAPAVLAQASSPSGQPAAPAARPAESVAPATPLQEVVVTANPLGSGLFELVQPATVLSGPALDARRASSLGETLSGELSVSSTGFGPNASRPVIRGLDGDRIRLLQNGATSIDASSVSFDHATAIEPLVAERIEVVRGPAALMYGGSALGGVVNVIDNRIPTAPIQGVGGRAELRYGGAERERAGVAVVEGGNGRFAWHADAYRRDTEDLRIPGFARSARQREIDAAKDPDAAQPRDRLPNTASKSEGGALGASATWADGHAGISFGSLRSDYGTPAEEDVGLRMRKDSVDLSGEVRNLQGFVRTLRLRANQTDYRHDEYERDSGEVGSTFRNRGSEIRLEAVHADLGPFKGAFGLQRGRSDFSTQGDEAYLPRTNTDTTALFVYEELARDRWKLNFGGRVERGSVASAGDAGQGLPEGEGRFGAAQTRSFTARNFSGGGLYSFTPALSLAANASYIERMPTHYELFSNGPHAATGTWEIGDPTLALERSRSLDLALRHRSGPNLISAGVWQTRFSNYLELAGTGRNRGEDGSLEDPSNPGFTTSGEAAELPEYAYRQVPATFRGIELLARQRLFERVGSMDLELKADRVSASNRDTGEPLPRIAPLRYGASLVYREGPMLLRGDLTHVAAQRDVAQNELPTDAYTMLNAYANWRIRSGSVAWDLFARANNLLNQEARNHTSLIKDIAPLGARSLMVGVRAIF